MKLTLLLLMIGFVIQVPTAMAHSDWQQSPYPMPTLIDNPGVSVSYQDPTPAAPSSFSQATTIKMASSLNAKLAQVPAFPALAAPQCNFSWTDPGPDGYPLTCQSWSGLPPTQICSYSEEYTYNAAQTQSLGGGSITGQGAGITSPVVVNFNVTNPLGLPATSATLTSSALGTPTTLPANGGQVTIQLPDEVSSATYTATVVGPGGSTSCSITVNSVCNPQQVVTYSPNWVPNVSGFFYIPNDDPPECDWQKCDPNYNCAIRAGGTMGCFAPETQMLMGDGTLKVAKKIVAGDLLWNPIRQEPQRVKSIVVGPEKKPLIGIGYMDAGRWVIIHVTEKHPMATGNGLKKAMDLTSKDWLRGSDQRFHKISLAQRLPVRLEQFVYNFVMDAPSTREEDHMIVGDGMITGDYFLQTQLEKGNLP